MDSKTDEPLMQPDIVDGNLDPALRDGETIANDPSLVQVGQVFDPEPSPLASSAMTDQLELPIPNDAKLRHSLPAIARDETFRKSRKRKRQSDPLIGPSKRLGRPPKPPGTKARRRPKQPKGRTILRGQVQHVPPLDVWTKVWEYASPSTLLTMERVCRLFRDELHRHPAIWKAARRFSFDRELPDPPPGLSEPQYAQLLCGFGCQSCFQKKARKVYWCWTSRWCEDCLQKLTVQEPYLIGAIPEERILETIRCGTFDLSSRWFRVGSDPHVWRNAEHRIYLREDVQNKISEYKTFIETKPTEEQITQWLNDGRAEARKTMTRLQEIERCLGRFETAEMVAKKRTRDRRRQDIIDHCRLMNPPVTPAQLKLMHCFTLANRIDRPLNSRCWKALKPKILAEHASVLRVEREKSSQAALSLRRRAAEKVFGSENSRILTPKTPGTEVISKLCSNFLEKELGDKSKWKQDRGRDVQDAEDFYLKVLRQVRRDYYALEDEMRPKTENGEAYVPTMRDVCNLVETELEQLTSLWNIRQRNKARCFKCPRCKRADKSGRHMGVQMAHIISDHSFVEPDFAPLRCMYEPYRSNRSYPVPRYEVIWEAYTWPKNLPVMSVQQSVRDEPWDPDNEMQYCAKSSSTDEAKPLTLDHLYQGRNPSPAGPEPEKIVDSIIFAAEKLQGTSLSAEAQTLFALDFAIKRNLKLKAKDSSEKITAETTGEATGEVAAAAAPTLQAPAGDAEPTAPAGATPATMTDPAPEQVPDAMIDPELLPDAPAAEATDPIPAPALVVRPPFRHPLHNLASELVTAYSFDILVRAKCGICSQPKLFEYTGRRHEHTMSVGPLLTHFFEEAHTGMRDRWPEGLWRKPSYDAINRELERNAKGRRAFEELFPRIEDLEDREVLDELEWANETLVEEAEEAEAIAEKAVEDPIGENVVKQSNAGQIVEEELRQPTTEPASEAVVEPINVQSVEEAIVEQSMPPSQEDATMT